MLHVISEGLTSGDEATFLKVDTALVKTHLCWMVKEPSACLPPRSPARKCCLIAFQNPCSQTNGKFRVPRQWQCPLHAASLPPSSVESGTNVQPTLLFGTSRKFRRPDNRPAGPQQRKGWRQCVPSPLPSPTRFLLVRYLYGPITV